MGILTKRGNGVSEHKDPPMAAVPFLSSQPSRI